MGKRHRARHQQTVVAPAPRETTASWFVRSTPVLVHVAAAWLLGAGLELLLSGVVAREALAEDQLPPAARVALVAQDLTALLVFTLAVGGVLSVGRIGAPLGATVRRLTAVAQTAIIGAVVLLYAVSWTEFWHVGAFLDRSAFLFWLPNSIQVFHWVYPPVAAGVLAAVVALTAILAWWVPRRVAAASASGQRRLTVAAVGAAGLCVAVAAAGELVYGSPRWAGEPRFAFARDHHSGPLLHALADAGASWRSAEVPPPTALDDAKTIRRPIVSMDAYLRGVDRSRFRPWNVLMIQIESLRSDQLRAYGGTRDVMPAVDALAAASHVFTNAYIQASHSNYADLVPLSSQYPLRSSEVYTYPEHPAYPRVLIYDILKALGYKTAIFSSQNETWGGMINFHRPEHLDRFFHAATFDGPTYAPWEDITFAEWVKETKGAGSVDDRYTTSAAIKWLDSLQGSPFFMHMNLQSSHVPYVVPRDFRRPFGPPTLDFTIMWGRFPKDKIQVVKDRYADSLSYEDTQIARLLAELRRLGLWDRTLVVIGGDNGEAFYEHGFASHATALFNEVMKVPMIVRVPGERAVRDDRPAMFLDIPPTILDLLGLPPHPGFQGVSLAGAPPDPARSLYMIAQTPVVYQTAIVRSGFKLLFAERSGSRYLGAYLLFDLVHDPGEQVDVSSANRAVVDDLSARLQRWRREQLAYYADPAREAREYPPVLLD